MTAARAPAPPPYDPRGHRGLQGVMTAQHVGRQFLLLFAAATVLLIMAFFIEYYDFEAGKFSTWWDNQPNVDLKIFVIPLIPLIIYGYVLVNGILFTLGPSERSFNFFFAAMMLAVIVANYDQSILDWIVKFFAAATLRPQNVVSALKILFAALFFLILIVMPYNILSDDFARRMLRPGVTTEEVARIRPGMFKVLIPAILTAGAAATGLALLGEFSSLIFGQGGLFVRKVQVVLLAALVVPMAFLIRSILRDLARQRESAGPNR